MKKQIAIFLYSQSDTIAIPWADAGIECHLFDLLNQDRSDGNIIYHGGQVQRLRKKLGRLCLENEVIIGGSFTPCDDQAVSGTRHFDTKAKNDALFWAKSYELCTIGVDLFEFFNIPYFIENPKSVLSTLWRKPDFTFHPYEYGGYLPENHQHRFFPELYPPRDAYHKETWIWGGNGYNKPVKNPVKPIEKDYPGFKKLGGKSARTKEIRSSTPEGFARAVFEANHIRKFAI